MGTDVVLAELAQLAELFPIPDPSWHGYVAEMREVAADLAAATQALELLPGAADLLAHRIETDADDPVETGDGSLAAAAARLRRLPLPAGEHPFLDEIRLTVEATAHALAALASVEGGEAAFAAARDA